MTARTFRFWGRLVVLAACLGALIDGFWIEPAWLRVRRVTLARPATLRVVHITDFHYKGDREFLDRIVDRVNAQDADFVCFTGDLAEDTRYLDEALAAVRRIRKPVYGVPGNHEYWSSAPSSPIAEAFAATGGAWLEDRTARCGDVEIEGLSGQTLSLSSAASEFARPGQRMPELPPPSAVAPPAPAPGEAAAAPPARRLLLAHYPAVADAPPRGRYDLILAGHSHGGQVRVPLFGALIVPYGVGRHERGLYDTPAGPLHVSVGLGTFWLPVRFLCRPEIVVIEL